MRFSRSLLALLISLFAVYIYILIRTTAKIPNGHPGGDFLPFESDPFDRGGNKNPAPLPRKESTTNTTVNKAQARFVFIIGIEGTGHSLMKAIIKDSPHAKWAIERGLWSDVIGLQDVLNEPKSGLMNLHCGLHGMKIVDATTGLPDIAGKYNKVVAKMRTIAGEVAGSPSSDGAVPPTYVSVPLNLITHEMASYPMDSDECRPLKFPDLDIVYEACNDAGVLCQHVYLYRDPYAVLKSTTKNRGFEASGLKAIHLYITMLKVLYAQLTAHANRTAGCFNFYDTGDGVNDTSGAFWDPIRDMFGWASTSDHVEFRKYIQSKYKPPAKLTDADRKTIVPQQYEEYIKSMIQANDNASRLCHRQLAEVEKMKETQQVGR